MKLEKIKESIIILSLFATMMLLVLRLYSSIDFFKVSKDICDYIVCAELFLVAALSIKDPKQLLCLKKDRFKLQLVVAVPYLLTGILTLAASLLHAMGPSYRAWVFIMIVAYGAVYYVWAVRGDYERLFLLISYALLLYSIVMLIWCLTEPYVQDASKDYRYAGDYGGEIFDNPNVVPRLLIPGLAGMIYLMKTTKCFLLKIIVSATAGGLILFSVICHSRTGYLMLASLLCVIIIEVTQKKSLKKHDKQFWRRLIILMGVAIISACMSFCIVTILKKDTISKIPPAPQEIVCSDAWIETMEELNIVKESFADNKLLVKLNDFSTDRIAIWIWYGKQLKPMGTDAKYLPVFKPHNQIIELAFRGGIIAGISWLIFYISSFVLTCVAFIKKKTWSIFSLSVLMVFICESMLDYGVFPMHYLYIFVAYFALAPLLIKFSDEKKN